MLGKRCHMSIPARFRRPVLRNIWLLVIPMLGALLLTGCNKELKQELATRREQADQDHARIAQLEAEVKSLSEKAPQLQATIENQALEMQKSASRADELQARLSGVTEKYAALEKELASKETQLATTVGKLAVFEAEQKSREEEARAAARHATIVAQLGVTMQSGDTKPVTNTTVYLMKAELLQLVPETFTSSSDVRGRVGAGTDLKANAAGVLHFAPLYPSDASRVTQTLERSAVRTSTSDFSGRATFEDVEPGDYYVLCSTPLGGGAVLEKKVHAAGKSTFVALDNSDVLDEFSVPRR